MIEMMIALLVEGYVTFLLIEFESPFIPEGEG